jgi:lysophospholipase L1-like esterase
MQRLAHFAARRIAPVLAALVLSLLVFAPAVASTHPFHVHPHFVGPKTYYLALGDSLAYGYQPDFNWDDGYNDDFYAYLQSTDGNLSITNYACPGETSVSFLTNTCPFKFLVKNWYWPSQMQAALNFIAAHPGQVSPVTLDMGANDLLSCFSNGNINQSCAQQAFTNVEQNLPIIYSNLVSALHGQGDLLIMDYYDPYISQYPSTIPYVEQLNQIIQTDAARYGIPVVDIYPQFTSGTICSYTWICSIFNDVHCNDTGYSVIAGDFEQLYPYSAPHMHPEYTIPRSLHQHLTPQQIQYLRTHF